MLKNKNPSSIGGSRMKASSNNVTKTNKKKNKSPIVKNLDSDNSQKGLKEVNESNKEEATSFFKNKLIRDM